MITVGYVFAALAALLHVYIFVLESVLWTKPRARRVFGTTAEEAIATQELALNQGFYNLFLAFVAAAGVVALARDYIGIGAALVYAGAGSMLLAALVLLVTSPGKARSAATQGTLPLLSVLFLSLGLYA
ncbi:DUF1304 domain-containing protein [Amycolatopsis sp. GM8]|uniref:DUF1304 domain-containing protein n=1 Tax=Amycolatopsis sp. GM8 TaxID=2896530 RepID=UPI001F34ABBE|nr:DUF1304 domain-containing protein [Amycolatopsis sp. GM8]